MHLSNIRSMYAAVEAGQGFDAIIIVSSSQDQAQFWQKRLESSRGTVTSRKAQVISVEENWPGGAGQLLGTLYAFQKASSILNLHQILARGGTIAMYHTAGKGTRMAPITAAEANNKSAIKLPRLIEIDGVKTPLTVLEAVIFQTGIFATSRPGRLGVFWGDQVFIPSRSVDFEGHHHAEILDIRDRIPADEDSWKRSWQSYGLIIPDARGDALQREKQCWDDLGKLTASGLIKPDESGRVILGKSLGCFSVSHSLLSALLEEFAAELAAKQAKMDTDPHLWMPLTSTKEQFTSCGGSPSLWERLDRFKQRFLLQDRQGLRLFGDKDLGADTLWWDYGQLRLYHQNFLKALEDSFEGACLRQFYDLEQHRITSFSKEGLTVENSILVDAPIKGAIKNSILLGVQADSLDSTNSVVMSSCLGRARIDTALIYGCIDLNDMELNSGEVAADVFLPELGRVRMRTAISRDGKEDWERLILGNPYTFEALSRLVGSRSEAGILAERSNWMSRYQNRERIKSLVHSFIKPATDNLVEIVWGGDYIEKMKGLPPSGKKIAESWECSTHPNHSSRVYLADGSAIPLSDLVTLMSQDILGHQLDSEFNGRLPILFKFLDAREDLSVQVHPSDEKARELGESDTGKTEAWVVLKAEKGAVLYLGFKDDVDKAEFERDLTQPSVNNIGRSTPSDSVNIAEKYLNAIPARVGDVLINPTGTVHAIGKGVVLAEIQQSSGITYRVWDWNRVPQRPLHIDKAMASLNFKKTTKANFELTPIRISDKEERLIDSFYFSLDRLTLASGDALDTEVKGGFQILTCLQGQCELIGKSARATIGQWESLLVPASMGPYQVTAQADSVLLRSFVLTPRQIDPVIFQTYDVRAIADKYLSDRVCYYLGKGYGTFLRRQQGVRNRVSENRGQRECRDTSLPGAWGCPSDSKIPPEYAQKGSTEGSPSAGVLGVSPKSLKKSPKELGDSGGLVEVQSAPTVVVGGGVRLSTERVRQQLIKGILSTGVNVLDVGVTSTPELYFSIPYLNADGGVNITASHNEAEYNGLKQVIRSADGFITSINADQMLEIKRTVLESDFLEGEGKYARIEEGEVVRYHNELVKANCRLGRAIWIELLQRWQDKGLRALLDVISKLDFPEKSNKRKWAQICQALDLPADIEQPATAIKHPFAGLIAVIDFGNGSAWRTAEVYSDLGAEVMALNDSPDGSFPAHIPDPIKAKYRKQLEQAVTKEAARSKKEVVGIGNDEDADRVIYVRSDGQVVEGDRTLAIQAKPIIEEHARLGKPGKPRFLGEVKFSRVAEEYITSLGGEYILSPTGFAFIKDGTKALARALRAGEPEIELFGRKIDLRENKEPIALAAELSGHQMSGHEENWIFDDALLASIKVLSAIAAGLKEGKTFIDLDEAVPRYPATPELNIRLSTNILTEKQEVVDAVLKVFRHKGYPIDTTDGGLIKWTDQKGNWLGQALVRKSNTQPMIICRVEGKDEKSKQAIEDEFFKELSKVSTKTVPKLDLASDDYIKGILPRVMR